MISAPVIVLHAKGAVFTEFVVGPFEIGVFDGAQLHWHIVDGATGVPMIFRPKEATTFKFHDKSQSKCRHPQDGVSNEGGSSPIEDTGPVGFEGADERNDEVEDDEDGHHEGACHDLLHVWK